MTLTITQRIEALEAELGLYEDQNLATAAENCRAELDELKAKLGYVSGCPWPAYAVPRGNTVGKAEVGE